MLLLRLETWVSDPYFRSFCVYLQDAFVGEECLNTWDEDVVPLPQETYRTMQKS